MTRDRVVVSATVYETVVGKCIDCGATLWETEAGATVLRKLVDIADRHTCPPEDVLAILRWPTADSPTGGLLASASV